MSEATRVTNNTSGPQAEDLKAHRRLPSTQTETHFSAGSHVDSLDTDRPAGWSVFAFGLVAQGGMHTESAAATRITSRAVIQIVLLCLFGGMALTGPSTAMPIRTTDVRADADITVAVVDAAQSPAFAHDSDIGSNQAPSVHGTPAVSAQTEAFPPQEDVVAIQHEYTRHRATGIWGDFEPLLLDHFDGFCDEHFLGTLPKVEIKMGQCSSPRTVLGQYAFRGDHGMLSEITINERLFANRVKGVVLTDSTRTGFLRYIDDILLHEMVHLYCDRILAKNEPSYRGHGPVFTAECNRIGAKLGLAPVRHAKSKKKIEEHMHRSNQWPQCVRDPAYYLGAVVDIPDKDEEEEEPIILVDHNRISAETVLRRLAETARGTSNTQDGLRGLAHALIASLRTFTQNPGLLPQFPADLGMPGPTAA